MALHLVAKHKHCHDRTFPAAACLTPVKALQHTIVHGDSVLFVQFRYSALGQDLHPHSQIELGCREVARYIQMT